MTNEKGSKGSNIYCCETCDYTTPIKQSLQRHFETKKHMTNVQKKEVLKGSKGSLENPTEYCCEKCNFKTFHKHKWVKHLKTKKHKNNTSQETTTFNCACGKVYKHSSSLSNHKKKCKIALVNDLNNIKLTLYDGKKDKTQIKFFEEMIGQMVKYEPQQPTQIINNTYNNIYNTTTNSNNHTDNSKNINVMNYLNTHCKDAMKLSDLAENIVYTIKDVDKLTDEGYLTNTTNAFKQTLDNMEETNRPFHCVDKKRKKFYIKDQDGWERDKDNQKLKTFLNDFNRKQCQQIKQWKILNADNIEKFEHIAKKSMDLIIYVYSMYEEKGDKTFNKLMNYLTEFDVKQNSV